MREAVIPSKGAVEVPSNPLRCACLKKLNLVRSGGLANLLTKSAFTEHFVSV
jgi:hypothetical protein